MCNPEDFDIILERFIMAYQQLSTLSNPSDEDLLSAYDQQLIASDQKKEDLLHTAGVLMYTGEIDDIVNALDGYGITEKQIQSEIQRYHELNKEGI